MPLGSEEDNLHLEILKLLMQIALCDHTLDSREIFTLEGLGRSWSVPEAELEKLKRCLKEQKPLPAPNMGLLRKHQDEVLEAAQAMAATDGKVVLCEKEIISQIREMFE